MTKQTDKRLIVVGGGAAGFFGAIHAKQNNSNLQVLILESAKKPLGKVKISGGGRCNVTHHCFDVSRLVKHYPRGERELKSVFSRFGPEDTMRWFEERGVPLKTESDNRVFPVSDESQSIIDCLTKTAEKQDITRSFLIQQYLEVLEKAKEQSSTLNVAKNTLDSLAHISGLWLDKRTLEVSGAVNHLASLNTGDLIQALNTAQPVAESDAESVAVDGEFRNVADA